MAMVRGPDAGKKKRMKRKIAFRVGNTRNNTARR